nr:immunoglobulin light chain junction region [Macaca mulatta]
DYYCSSYEGINTFIF